MMNGLEKFPLAEPDRKVDAGQMTIWEWQQNGIYFEIEKYSGSDSYEIMIEKDGEFEHWTLKRDD